LRQIKDRTAEHLRDGMVPVTRQSTAEAPMIVIVDDDPAILNSLRFALEIEGMAVRTYQSGESLLGAEALPATDCLVIDHRLPGMDGLALLDQLRARGAKPPAILITSHPSEAVQRLALAAGMTIVEKPLLGDTLINAIRNAIDGKAPGADTARLS
jgi:FixJ family two-component response regulator